jgi:hypothetical protein
VLDPSGEVGTTIELDDKAAKKTAGDGGYDVSC